MHRLLYLREIGLHEPRQLSEIEKTRRAYSVELSTQQIIGSSAQTLSAINFLEIATIPSCGRFLLSCDSKATVGIHRLGDGQEPCKRLAKVDKTSTLSAHKLSIETVTWYPHDLGMFLSSSVDGTVKVWDANALQCVEEFTFRDMVYRHQMSAISTSHSLVAVACRDSRVYLADLRTGSATHILKGHKKDVLSVSWSTRDPNLLASGSRDNKVLLWDTRKATGYLTVLDQHRGKQSGDSSRSKTSHNGHVNSLHFSTNGLYLLSYGTDDRLRLWDVRRGENTLVNYGRISNQYSKSVKIVVSCTKEELVFLPSASDIKVVEVHTGKHVTILRGHYHNVNCCEFEDEYQELYSGSNDSNILAWLPALGHALIQPDVRQHSKETDLRTKYGPTGYQDTWSSDEEG